MLKSSRNFEFANFLNPKLTPFGGSLWISSAFSPGTPSIPGMPGIPTDLWLETNAGFKMNNLKKQI
jgi:hypothetical protein